MKLNDLFNRGLLIIGTLLLLTGCYASYEHTIKDNIVDGEFYELYKVEYQSDEFIKGESVE